MSNKLKNKLIFALIGIGSLVLLAGSYFKFFPMSLTEDLGFITGAACVWLTVLENVWNWPIGIANAIFFIILFWTARFYADMSLQLVYVVLGVLGWYWWLKGGKNKTTLKISRMPLREYLWLIPLFIASTGLMTWYLTTIHDSAPFFDALTTVMSLYAQYQLTRKYLENWYMWIAADVIYIGLYAYKNLYLTSFLYLIFLMMCIKGLIDWKKTHRTLSITQYEKVPDGSNSR